MKIKINQLKQIIREEIQRLSEDTCPCGIERADCDYHKPPEVSQEVVPAMKRMNASKLPKRKISRAFWKASLGRQPDELDDEELENALNTMASKLPADVQVEQAKEYIRSVARGDHHWLLDT